MTLPPEEHFPSYRAKQADIDAAWELCEQRFSSLPEPLRNLATQFLQSIADQTGSHRSYFSSSVAPPLLYMPLWLIDGLMGDRPADKQLPTQSVVSILAATMQGYIGIRLQDDVLDEPSRSDTNLLLLGNTCFSYMIAELSSAMRAHADLLWQAVDRAIVEFSQWTLAEQHKVTRDDSYVFEDFDKHADKVAFARIPMLAVAAMAGRMDLEPAIQTLVHQLGIAYGIANDVLGWPRDLQSGQRTWLLASAGFTRNDWEIIRALPEGAERENQVTALVEKLRVELYEKRRLHNALARAIEYHRRAQETATRIGLVGFDDYTNERIAWIEMLDRQTSLMTLQRALRTERT